MRPDFRVDLTQISVRNTAIEEDSLQEVSIPRRRPEETTSAQRSRKLPQLSPLSGGPVSEEMQKAPKATDYRSSGDASEPLPRRWPPQELEKYQPEEEPVFTPGPRPSALAPIRAQCSWERRNPAVLAIRSRRGMRRAPCGPKWLILRRGRTPSLGGRSDLAAVPRPCISWAPSVT